MSWCSPSDSPPADRSTTPPDRPTQQTQLTSIDDVEFVEGGRYLVTASETGTVSTCGYTGEWSASMAADFEQAFGR